LNFVHHLQDPLNNSEIKVSKAMVDTGRGGMWSCEMLRIPNFLDKRLTNGGEIVSLKRRQRSAPQKHFLMPISK
jgi:hypothetical protein